MSLSNRKIDMHVEGSGNNVAAGDLYVDNSIHLPSRIISSHIEVLLQNISEIQASETLKAVLPDTADYTIEDKIEFNNIQKYKEFLDFYMENSQAIIKKLDIISEAGDLLIRKKIFTYIVNKFMEVYKSGLSSDELIDLICQNISAELKSHSHTLTLEDISCVPLVVFYVFSECKIFKKPS